MSSQESMPLDEESVAQMPQEPALVEPKFHPLDVILSLLRYKRWLVICPLIAAVIAFAFVSTQLPRYSAMARLLPPKTKPNTATMLSQTGSLAGAGVDGVLEGQKPVVDMYLAILQSRAAAEFMDSNFDLRKRWGVSSIESVYGRLSSMSKIAPSPNGIINIEIEDSDPVWAARLANGYADALQYITQGLAVNEASKRRVFYEQQMNVSLQQLTVAQMSLRKIQQETGVLNLDPQIQMAIQESNRLRTAIASKETELASMEAFATERNADYLRLQHEIDALKNQLEQWRRPVKASDDVALQASEGLLPEISMEYVKHVREVKNLELVYELFLKELQLTRIDQVKDATTVELLDKAIPPSTPSYPKKKRTIAIASLIGFLIAMVSILIYELTVVALKNEVNMSRVRMIREALRWSPPSVRFPRKLKFNVKFKRKNKE
ncbi:GumC family protein [Rivihabitans pingtungensis]|mgnify:FL=1|uniref:GumC family protein n=1 Tax=Rivihabitans pingtungensis TaxID=1054498 RepID=UPI002CAC45EF|nr:GNVR domain-containing protein [Rivihabitans pingtungensis]HNX71800.1 GNVR domain-containing protein [Rivihabitans pingtungensis]